MSGRAAYPKAFMTPSGRMVSIRTMGRALKEIRQKPDLDYQGWEWFEVSGRSILRDFMAGVHDRINTRARPRVLARR